MAEETAKKFYNTGCDVDVEAYKANYGAHREGITSKDMADYYTQWAKSGGYEVDLSPGRYNGPEICAGAVAETFPTNRDKVKLIDIAAGTGFLAERLVKIGFNPDNLDALDPAEGMLAIAEKKNVYKRLICDGMDDHRIDVDDDTYDCLAIAGGMGEGHIPASSITEMIRMVKPGGHVIIVMREEYLTYVADYMSLESNMAKLEEQGLWKKVIRKVVPNYSFGKNGIVFNYKKL